MRLGDMTPGSIVRWHDRPDYLVVLSREDVFRMTGMPVTPYFVPLGIPFDPFEDVVQLVFALVPANNEVEAGPCADDFLALVRLN